MTGGHLTHIINMANSIVGVSILSMPYCFKETGIVLGILLVLISGFITKKTCMFLVRSAIMSRRRSFEFLAFHVFGVSGKLFVELCMILFLIGICISFHVVMGDLAPAIIARSMNIDNSPSLRVTLLIGIAVLVILPLCLLRNIESLSSMSACSIGFYFFLIAVILSHALPKLLDGSWYTMAEMWKLDGAFQVLPICSLALACQSNVFEIYDSVPDPDVPKMRTVVNQAVNLCSALYIGVGFLGYVAFVDKDFGGNIIMSFPSTSLTEGIKMFFVVSLAISFPLMIFPCRTSIHSLLYRRNTQGFDMVGNYMPDSRFKGITLGILFISLIFGILIPSIETVLGLLGSTMGMLIALILPSVLFIKVHTKRSNDRLFAQFIMLFGCIMIVTGTYLNLSHINRTEASQPEVPIPVAAEQGLYKIPEQKPPYHNIPPAQDKDEKSVIKNPETVDKEIRKEPVAPEPPPEGEPEKDQHKIVQEKVDTKDNKMEVEKSRGIQEEKSNDKKQDNVLERKEPKAVIGKKDEANKDTESNKKSKKTPDILHPDAIVKEEQEAEEEGDVKVKESQDGKNYEKKQEELLQKMQKQQQEQHEILVEQKKLLQELKEQKEEIHDAGEALAAAGILQQQVNAAAQMKQAVALQQGQQQLAEGAQLPQAGGAVVQGVPPVAEVPQGGVLPAGQPIVQQKPVVQPVLQSGNINQIAPAIGNPAPQLSAGNIAQQPVNPVLNNVDPQPEVLEQGPAKHPAPLELEVKPVGNAPPEVQKEVQEAIKKIHEGQAALQKAQEEGHIALEPAAVAAAPAEAAAQAQPIQNAAPAVGAAGIAKADAIQHEAPVNQHAAPVNQNAAQVNPVQYKNDQLPQALPNPGLPVALGELANAPIVQGRQLKGQSVVSSAPIEVKIQNIPSGNAVSNGPRVAYEIKENKKLVPPQQMQKLEEPKQLLVSQSNIHPSGRKGELENSQILSNKDVSEKGPVLNVLTDAVDQKSKKETKNEKAKINKAADHKSKKETKHEESKIISNKEKEINIREEVRRKRDLENVNHIIEGGLPLVDLEKDLKYRNIGEMAYDTRHLLWTERKRKKGSND